MIKAFDHCTTKINWSSSQHYACSEIRATNLSGDCKFDRELMRGNIGIMKHHQACVRRRVLEKMKRLAEFKEGNVAQDSVDAVFDICFKDTAPFDEIY
jgi:inner membrane protease ATP23